MNYYTGLLGILAGGLMAIGLTCVAVLFLGVGGMWVSIAGCLLVYVLSAAGHEIEWRLVEKRRKP